MDQELKLNRAVGEAIKKLADHHGEEVESWVVVVSNGDGRHVMGVYNLTELAYAAKSLLNQAVTVEKPDCDVCEKSQTAAAKALEAFNSDVKGHLH